MTRKRWYWFNIALVLGVLAFVLPIRTSFAVSSSTPLTDTEIRLLVDSMLNMPNIAGLTTDRDNLKASLARYRQMTAMRLQFYKDRKSTQEHLKTYLFIVFVSDAANMVHSLEEIAKNEILVVFRDSPQDVLSVLKGRPFLAPAICRQLNAHFELFGDSKDRKRFVEQYGNQISEALGKIEARRCEIFQ